MSQNKITRSAKGEECQITWRPVVDWEGLYEVSSDGSVRSVARLVNCRHGKRNVISTNLKQFLSKEGYRRVALYDGPRSSTVLVHRLVAKAFVPGVGEVVRHLDGNRLNNTAENLAWGSYKDNEADKARHGKKMFGESHPRAKLSLDLVTEVKKLLAAGVAHLEISKRLPIGRSNVWAIAKGKTWGHVENN